MFLSKAPPSLDENPAFAAYELKRVLLLKCGRVKSNFCCQVGMVPVVLGRVTGLQNAVKHKDFCRLAAFLPVLRVTSRSI